MLVDEVKQILHAAAKSAPWAEHAPDRWQDFPLETPKNSEHGDYATNMAMRLAKPLKRAPLQIAEELAAGVDTSGAVASVEVVKPGFINIRVSRAALRGIATLVRAQGADYGKTSIGAGRKVQVEFVSANPTGPLSVGHGRLAAYGDALARILGSAGFDVQREFYVNDVGNQINNLANSPIKRKMQADELGIVRSNYEDIEDYVKAFVKQASVNPPKTAPLIDGEYQGDDVIASSGTAAVLRVDIKLIRDEEYDYPILFKLLDENIDNISNSDINEFRYIKTTDVERVKESLIKERLDMQKNTLKKFNVTFDHWFRESELHVTEDDGLTQVDRVLKMLEYKGDMYVKDDAVWFASSRYLDEKDRVVKKSDGNKTYLMSDIAYIYNKLGVRSFDTAIYVWGADHHGYIDRIKSAGQALGFSPAQLEVLIVQLVSIKGERMSKRRGNIIYLDDLIDEVGADATRFFFIARPPGTHCDFDMDLARDKSENNPMYYLQYVHARICSMIEKAAEAGLKPDNFSLDDLGEPREMELLKMLGDFPWEVQGAALAREPHRIINYLTAVAGKFHSFYHDHKVIQPEQEGLSRARLALCDAVRTVFRNGLSALGISAPERM